MTSSVTTKENNMFQHLRIRGFPNYYILSDGRVKNYYLDKFLKPNNIGNGYLQVTLYNEDSRKSVLIHRLVAEYFLPNPNNYTEVNHKDGNPSNNNIDNLEWVSPSMNAIHGYKDKKRNIWNGRNSFRKLDITQVETIRSLNKEISVKSMAKYFQVNRGTIRNILDYKTWPIR